MQDGSKTVLRIHFHEETARKIVTALEAMRQEHELQKAADYLKAGPPKDAAELVTKVNNLNHDRHEWDLTPFGQLLKVLDEAIQANVVTTR